MNRWNDTGWRPYDPPDHVGDNRLLVALVVTTLALAVLVAWIISPGVL